MQNVIDQIYITVNQFTTKFKQTLRILKLANNTVSTEKVFVRGFDGEVEMLMKKIQEIKEGLPEGTGRRSIDTNLLVENKKERHSFETALIKTV